jgi:hypothetical protein
MFFHVSIRYTAWLCRGMVSATSFTVVGVVNKFLTVLLSVMMFAKHSTAVGIGAVCVCLLCGVFYQQAPRRDDAKHPPSEKEVEVAGISKDSSESQPLMGDHNSRK